MSISPKVLVVDDDPVILLQIAKILQREGIAVSTAATSQEALLLLENMNNGKYNILITDLKRPGMDGMELIGIIKKQYPEIVIIVMSASIDVNSLLATLNENKAYSYLLKPISKEQILLVINKAFGHYNVFQKTAKFKKNEQRFYKEIMDTFDWKNEIFSRHVTSIAKDIIHQLNICLTHGEGIGSLLTALGLVLNSSKYVKTKEVYEVPRDIFHLVETNFKSSVKLINSISHAQNILMETQYFESLEKIPHLVKIVEDKIDSLAAIFKIKKQKVLKGDLPLNISDKAIILDKEKMGIVINEILINAMKYSGNEDSIFIMYFLKENYFEVKFLNPAQKNPDGTVGMLKEDERLIFEPFYRGSGLLVAEYFEKEEFSYGLGLTVVKKIMDLHKSGIFIYAVRNLSIGDRDNDICVTLRLPVIN